MTVISKKNNLLHDHVSKKNFSLDIKKADVYKDDILKQLDVISNSLGEIYSIINKLKMKNYFNKNSSGLAVQCMKKCLSQAQAAKTLSLNFEARYLEDQKRVIIDDLDNRIALLEEKITELK